MKKALPILIVILIIIAGVWYFSKPQATEDVSENMDGNRSLSLTLAEQNRSGQSGTVNIYEEGRSTRVVLGVRNAVADVTQPAHIHTGSCTELGGVKYPLTFPVNGESTTVLDISYDQLMSELPLAVNVHKSAAEAQVYVACADIVTTSGVSSTMPAPGNESVEEMIVNTEPNGDESTGTPINEATPPSPSVKTFNLTGKQFAFSQTEIRVNKGDEVTINFSSTEGFHDWVVDEFNARTDQVNTGGSTSISFTANRVGTFEYYCSVGQHRAQGMKGNLIVE